jgi:hypothetical protein
VKHQQVAGGQQVAEPLEPLSFDQVLALEAVEVAGRAVDVRKELCAQLQVMFQGDARELVRSYQQCSATVLVAVHTHAAVLQAAHALLASYLPLPPWAQLWGQADRLEPSKQPPGQQQQGTLYPSVASPHDDQQQQQAAPSFRHSHGSQVAAYTIRQILGEVLEMCSYHSDLQRFMPVPADQAGGRQQGTQLYLLEPGSQGHGLNFTSVMTCAAGYFGAEHLQALRLMGGEAAVAELLEQLAGKVQQLLQVGQRARRTALYAAGRAPGARCCSARPQAAAKAAVERAQPPGPRPADTLASPSPPRHPAGRHPHAHRVHAAGLAQRLPAAARAPPATAGAEAGPAPLGGQPAPPLRQAAGPRGAARRRHQR